jgi:hypothetical protein
MNVWSVEMIDIVAGLTGDPIILGLCTDGLDIGDVHDEVDKALGGTVLFRLLDDGGHFAMETAIDHIKGPLRMVKVRNKVSYLYGLRSILKEMEMMPGSQQSTFHFAKVIDNDPNKLCMQEASEFYKKLFGTGETGQVGYTAQARMMELHSIFSDVTMSEAPAKEAVLERLSRIDYDTALLKLISWHNAGKIQLSQNRFGPLAQDLGIELRK